MNRRVLCEDSLECFAPLLVAKAISWVSAQNGTFTPSWNPSSVGGDYANITIAYKAGRPLKPNTQPSVTIITEMHNGPIAETSGAQS